MKKTVLLMLGVLLCLALPARADFSVAVVVSSGLRPYTEARDGFRNACTGITTSQGARSIQPLNISEFMLSEQPDHQGLLKQLDNSKFDLLLAIGAPALLLLQDVVTTPICYILVPELAATNGRKPNVTGIAMEIPVARQLEAFLKAVPHLKRLGLIYDQKQSGPMVEEISRAAQGRNIELIASQASEPLAFPRLLAAMAGKIDGFWMLPDLTVTTPQTVEAMMLFSLTERVPIFTFAEKYLEHGATMAVGFDSFSLGGQAAAMASEILTAKDHPGRILPMPTAAPEGIRVRVNQRVAKQLGITINGEGR